MHQPLDVERAISIAEHRCSSIDNPTFEADRNMIKRASSSQQQEAMSCPVQLDKGLRCRVSTASSLSLAAAAAGLSSSQGGLAGHQLSNGSVGAIHRTTPLSSKDALGEDDHSYSIIQQCRLAGTVQHRYICLLSVNKLMC
jgi:hypothetical protein